MFQFIHGYLQKTNYWEGLVKRGFIDDTSGVKITQHALTPQGIGFNNVLAKGSPLYEVIKEANRTFYVDRLQGGTFYYEYPYSDELISFYKEMLGEKFLGFQMHEWASNLKQDWIRIADATADNKNSWTAEEITRALFKDYPFPVLFLETGSPTEFAKNTRPQSADDLLLQCESLFDRRMKSVQNSLLPTDSFYMAGKMEAIKGAKNLMPEIGAQISYTRLQLALTRGVSKANGLHWGTYYEPWGGEPFSTSYYKKDLNNEWFMYDDANFPYGRNGESGGSSRALQRRIYFYSYFSGAEFISEEWGQCNTFYDWIDHEITPYGAVKKEFLNFVKENPNRGTPYTPFAVVLPKELQVFDLSWLTGAKEQYLSFPASDGMAKYISKIVEVCKLIYGDAVSHHGNEGHVMTNSKHGDLFDFIYEDDADIFSRYEYVVDLTGKTEFSSHNTAFSNKILQTEDIDLLDKELNQLTRKLLPFSVEGDLHYLINRVDDHFLVTFFNNDGVLRTQATADKLIDEATKTAIINLTDKMTVRAIYDADNLTIEGTKATLSVGAGQLAIVAVTAVI